MVIVTVIVSCLREYFTLEGCGSPEIVIVDVIVTCFEYFTLGGCIGPTMSNAVMAAVVISLSLDLATWLGGRGMSY